MTIERQFEVVPMNWYKRRTPTEKAHSVTSVKVQGFEKIDNKYCTMIVEYDDGQELNFEARICCNRTYAEGRIVLREHWTVQGMDSKGNNVQVRLKE